MKRLSRITWRMMSYASAILLLATIALWVRSYWRGDEVIVVNPWKAYPGPQYPHGTLYLLRFESDWGEVFIGEDAIFEPKWGGLDKLGYHVEPASAPVNWKVYWGLRWDYWSLDGKLTATIFPHWALVVLFSLLPSIRLVGYLRRRRRFGAGRCSSCGYDLRATPQRCPECGATPLKQ